MPAPTSSLRFLALMPLRERFICALVCKAWAEAAAAATHSIVIKHRVQNLSGLQHWLEKHGDGVTVLQLHACNMAALTALPCCAKLQDLLLHYVSIASRTWSDIASATKITSISVSSVQTASQQADVVAALAALPNLEQLTWRLVRCSGNEPLSNSLLLQQMTRLTSLDLQGVAAAALQHLGSLTKLQHLSINRAEGWAAAGCPGLQELKALTSLELTSSDLVDLPPSISQLTALRQLEVCRATPTALNQLQVLTGLTQLGVWETTGLSPESPPLKLSGLRHLELDGNVVWVPMPISFIASCTQLQFLQLQYFQLNGPGSLVASTMLQHMGLVGCTLSAADGAADPVSWQQVLTGPGRLPHLTSLLLWPEEPELQQADIDHVVECCSNLRTLELGTLEGGFAPALARLPGLTNLHLLEARGEKCGLKQLTGLRQLTVNQLFHLSAVGLKQLAALSQLTSLGFGTFYSSQLDTLAQHLMRDDLPGCTYAIINKAPSGSPPDVSSQLQEICVVLDACEGLSIEAVIAAAVRELQPPGSPGVGRPKPLTAEALLAAAAALKVRGD